MIQIDHFTFNPFQENTYLLFDETGECIIIDPGMYDQQERDTFDGFIEERGLKPVMLFNTHCHIDHVMGNNHCAQKYNLELVAHKADIPTLKGGEQAAHLYGLNYDTSPDPTQFVEEGDVIRFGSSEVEVVFVPGHCPGHVALVSHLQRFVIGGDVLFKGSVGRVDLPGGDGATLAKSIQEKFYKLDDETLVYPGHGPATTIGFERKNNPFVSESGTFL
jgi:hydroxyacylglutathione hydrolase